MFDEDGAHSHKPFPPSAPRPCIFEYVYFSRPDSIIDGRSVYQCPQDLRRGACPRSSGFRRRGGAGSRFGRACGSRIRPGSGIPYELGIIRNHYIGRTFIEPTQHIRQLGVRLKHSANRAVVERQAHRADRRLDRARYRLR